MPCIRCNNPKTIKAHLIPQVFCREVQVGKMHAASIKENGSFHPSQSGTFDRNLLCDICDKKLGRLEQYAAKILAQLRRASSQMDYGIGTLSGADKTKLVRFCAAILWKYSITKKIYGKIDLDGFQEDIKHIAYGEIDIPYWFDAVMFRLKTHPLDAGVFAYRAPLIDEKKGICLYRFMLGGVLFLVKVDKQKNHDELANLWLSNQGAIPFLVAPARHFEEYQIAQRLAFSSKRLSSFLDKRDEEAGLL